MLRLRRHLGRLAAPFSKLYILGQLNWQRVGFEPTKTATEAAAPEGKCESDVSASSLLASLNLGKLREELSEIGEAWPKLPDSVRLAILTRLRASRKAVQREGYLLLLIRRR